MKPVDRRSFVLGASGAAAAVLTGAAIWSFGGTDSSPAASATSATDPSADRPAPTGRLGALASLLVDSRPAARIGAVYLADYPDGLGADPLRDLPAGGVGPGVRPAQVAAPVSARARSDFSDGTVVEVAGWLLPRSVADLCAVAHRELR